MSLMTAGEKTKLNNMTPYAKTIDLASRLNLGQTLQCPGRPATGHLRIATNPNDADTVTVTVMHTLPSGLIESRAIIYEIESSGGVTAGHVAVAKGGTAALTAVALAAAIHGQQGDLLASAVHATDTAVIDLRVRTPGGALTLATSSGGRMVVQDNAEELSSGETQLYMVRRAVTAEDDTRDRVRIDTGLASIASYHLRVRTSATNNTELAWDGAVTVTGGVIEMDNTGSTDLAAGNIVSLIALGAL